MRSKPVAVFMAFGIKGDVYPLAALATAFACDWNKHDVLFQSVHEATKLNDMKSVKGTAFWMAPEKNHGYGLPADIWSLGCTVLEMLTGQVPYSHLEGMQALCRIRKGEPPLIRKTLSGDVQDFILKCLQVNQDDRPTASQLLVHPFVSPQLQ